MTDYLEFGLEIRPEGDGYAAELLDRERGDALETFQLPDPRDLKVLLLEMGQTYRGTRNTANSEQLQAAQNMGRLLFDTVITGAVKEKLNQARTDARGQETGVRVRLHLADDDQRLLNLPWEFLCDPRGQFLSLSEWTPIVRYIRSEEPPSALTFLPPLRVLVAISGAVPDGASQLDVDREWRLLGEEALAESIRRGLVAVDRVPASMPAIGRALRSSEYHVFHYIGHSGFSQGASALWLEDAEGGEQAWPGNALGQKLGPHRTLRLAVFNSCEGARQSATDHFAGIAPSLIRKGIPAVIGMQFAITDAAAILFSKSFYEALADGEPVDRAVWVARNEIHESHNDVEWGTPVLFLRSRDGMIFDRRSLSDDDEEALARHARWYREARDHLADQRWAEATTVLERLQAERADYLDTARLLEEARERIEEGSPGQGAAGLPTTMTETGEPSLDAPSDAETEQPDQDEPSPPPWAGVVLAVIITVVIVIVLISAFAGSS